MNKIEAWAIARDLLVLLVIAAGVVGGVVAGWRFQDWRARRRRVKELMRRAEKRGQLPRRKGL